MSKPPKLRGNKPTRREPYPLGEFPDDMALALSRQIVHRLATGQVDITGDDFGGMFASAIGGNHSAKPLGVTDVTRENVSWSAKTVQAAKPFEQATVRLISGRNSPAYSYGISDPKKNLVETGEAVLNIWNARVNCSLDDYDDLRVVVLVRNMSSLEFTLFEYAAGRYSPKDYEWRLNKAENLEGYEVATGEHHFTWQPHGSQFTILRRVPGSAYMFRINQRPGPLEAQHVLDLVCFKDTWVERVFT